MIMSISRERKQTGETTSGSMHLEHRAWGELESSRMRERWKAISRDLKSYVKEFELYLEGKGEPLKGEDAVPGGE